MRRFKFTNAFYKRFDKLSLRSKIMFLYFAVILVLINMLMVMSNNIIYNSFRKDYGISVLESAKQVAKNVEFRKDVYKRTLLHVSFDGELIQRLSQKYEQYSDCWDTANYIYNSFSFIRDYLPEVQDFRIYHTNKTFIKDMGIIWMPDEHLIAGISSEEWFAEVMSSTTQPVWRFAYDPRKGNYVMILSSRLNSLTSSMEGCVCLVIKSKEIFSSIVDDSFSTHGEYYIVNEDGTIFVATDAKYVGVNIADTSLNHTIPENETKVLNIGGTDRFVAVQHLSDNWRVIILSSITQFQNKYTIIKFWFLAIMLIFTVLSGLVILMCLNKMFARLDQIGERMSYIMKGQFDVKVQKGGSDEISVLEEQFNLMTSRLNDLLQEVISAQNRQKEEALKVLEAQINPHFLYNTLGIIRWEALDMGNEKLCNLVDAMTTFYRRVLNKGKPIIKVRDEIEHVRAYVSIQQIRYREVVQVKWDIDSEVLDFYTIKLLLQPIVENSYIHGMITSANARKLWISAKYDNDCIVYQVRDNGVGMSEVELKSVLEENGKNIGIGLRYIKEMVRHYYGDNGKFHVESEKGKGTTVTIKIPALSDEIPERSAMNV